MSAVRHPNTMATAKTTTSTHTITPKDLVEGFLRAANPEPLTIKSLLTVGETLGFSANAIRVAISRLCAKEQVISDSRSCYRLTDKTLAINSFTDRWRLGESRVRPWQAHWICCHLPQGMGRTERNQAQKALSWYGLKLGLSGLYIRPDNLNLSIQELNSQLIDVALTPNASLFRAYDFQEHQTQQWQRLWDIKAIETRYKSHYEKIAKSANNFFEKPIEQSLSESLILGGDTLRVLTLDPLLPAEMIDITLRKKLSDMMEEYEAQCRKLWTEVIARLEE